MVRVVRQLLERLPYEPLSRYRVLSQDDTNLWGWDAQARALASVVEELRSIQGVVLPLLAGVPRSSITDVTPFEGRPGHTLAASQAPRTIRDALAQIGAPSREI